MFRWLHLGIWIGGSCVIICPVCVCLSGSGSWWVCITTVNLLIAMFGSAYFTWMVICNIKSNGASVYPILFKSLMYMQNVIKKWTKEKTERTNSTSSYNSGKACFIRDEIRRITGLVHANGILPWYGYVSPDEQNSLQIKAALEEVFLEMASRVEASVKITSFASSVMQLYLQHINQFSRAVRKASVNTKCSSVLDVTGGREAVELSYRPLHPALRNPEMYLGASRLCKEKDAVDMSAAEAVDKSVAVHCCHLSHFLLLSYLPSEMAKCSLIFVTLRDLIAQNIFHSFVNHLCDTQWLNQSLAYLFLSSHIPIDNEAYVDINGDQEKELDFSQLDTPMPVCCSSSEKPHSCSHSRTFVREQMSFELSPCITASHCVSSAGNPSQELLDLVGEKADSKRSSLLCDHKAKVTDQLSGKDVKGTVNITTEHFIPIFANCKSFVSCLKTSSFDKTSGRKDEDPWTVSSALEKLISTTALPLLPVGLSSDGLPSESELHNTWKNPEESELHNTWENPKESNKDSMDTEDSKCNASVLDGVNNAMCEEECKLLPESLGISINGGGNALSSAAVPSVSSGPGRNGKAVVSVVQRSRSCGHLFKWSSSSENGSLEDSSRLCLSSEGIDALLFVDSKSNKEDSKSARLLKKRQKFVKMLSFDSSDGIVSFSVVRSPKQKCKEKSLTWLVDSDSHEGKSTLDAAVKDPPAMKDSQEAADDSTPDAGEIELNNVYGFRTSPNSLELHFVSEDSLPPSFGWENADLSPIYEESDNLASSIAKLRSLLNERESQHSLGSLSSYGSSESEPKSAQSDPGKYTLEKTRFSFIHKDSSGSLASVKSTSSSDSVGLLPEEELVEASEVPLDGRVFTCIQIPSTQMHTERSGSQYSLYTIQYDAIYLVDSSLLRQCAQDSLEPLVTQYLEEGGRETKMVLQTNCVKRRFREFLCLHTSLEEDASLKLPMKGIKGPNKWLNLPFGKMDTATISSRRHFLEKYLQSLMQRLEINVSPQLKEFLAYGQDASITFAKKPLDLNVPRLDKIFAKTVSGVFHSLRTALPTFDPAEIANGKFYSGVGMASAKGDLGTDAEGTEKDDTAFLSGTAGYEVRLAVTAGSTECPIEEALAAELMEKLDDPSIVDKGTEAEESPDVSRVDLLFHLIQAKRSQSVTTPCYDSIPMARHESQDESAADSCSWASSPLSLILFELLEVVLDAASSSVIQPEMCGHILFREPCMSLLAHLVAAPVNSMIEGCLHRMIEPASLKRIVQGIETSFGTNASNREEFHDSDDKDSRQRLYDALEATFPEFIWKVFGRDKKTETLNLLVESVQHPVVTKDLALHLVDLLVVQLLKTAPPPQ